MTKSTIIKEEDEVTDTDRLSGLPDSILCHILSFLPTRTSVATMSLVSPRLRHLWKHLQVFDFDDDTDDDENPEMFTRFASYVNNVLALRDSLDIRKFHLSGVISYDDGCCRPDYIHKWVRAATGPHLQELYLNFVSDGTGEGVLFPPPSILNCTNLVSLSLVGDIHLKVPHSSVHFPSLKMLTLDIDTVDSVVSFLSGCPMLETLDYCFEFDPQTKVPMLPSSKRFKFTNGNFSWTYLEIDARDDSSFDKRTLGIIGNLQSVVEAYHDVFSLRESEFVRPILNLISDQLDFIHLLLRHSTSKWPLHAPALNHPEFRNLHNLKFILPCFNSNLLVNVIEKCHMLQVLIIQSNKEEPLSPLRTWEPQSTKVPKCLESHLTYIHIEGYQGFEDELTFAEYILRKGLVLKTMLICVDVSMDITNTDHSLQRLTDIPRGSVMCQLKFDSVVSP